MIHRLMMGRPKQQDVEVPTKQYANDIKDPQVKKALRALLLHHMFENCLTCEKKLDNAVAQRKKLVNVDNQMLNFFKHPNATFLSATVFELLA